MKKILIIFVSVMMVLLSASYVCFAEEIVNESVDSAEVEVVETEVIETEVIETETAENIGFVVDPIVDEETIAESETDTSEDDGKTLREVLEEWLAKGDSVFAEQEWWAVLSAWVRANLDAIIACVGGLSGLIGSLLILLKANPKLRAYINSLGVSCKGWFEGIVSNMEAVVSSVNEDKSQTKLLAEEVKQQRETIALLVNTLEDVIKLSGASEAKKDIYIKEIEAAKARIAEGGDVNEV